MLFGLGFDGLVEFSPVRTFCDSLVCLCKFCGYDISGDVLRLVWHPDRRKQSIRVWDCM